MLHELQEILDVNCCELPADTGNSLTLKEPAKNSALKKVTIGPIAPPETISLKLDVKPTQKLLGGINPELPGIHKACDYIVFSVIDGGLHIWCCELGPHPRKELLEKFTNAALWLKHVHHLILYNQGNHELAQWFNCASIQFIHFHTSKKGRKKRGRTTEPYKFTPHTTHALNQTGNKVWGLSIGYKEFERSASSTNNQRKAELLVNSTKLTSSANGLVTDFRNVLNPNPLAPHPN